MKLFFVFAFFILTTPLFSQDSLQQKPVDSNWAIIHKDPRLDLLVKKQIEINELINRSIKRTAKGFRLLVINTNKRNEAVDAKSKVYTNFPELKVYLTYQSPYFRLKAGDFLERKDAEDYQKKLNKYFPKGVFVVNDIIEVRGDQDTDNP